MQDKIDVKDVKEDKGKLNDEAGKLGGDKSKETPKWDQGKPKDDVHIDKP